MRLPRFLRTAASCALAGIVPALLHAQAGDRPSSARTAPKFDVGVAVGVSTESDWFTTSDAAGRERGWSPGAGGTVGLTGTYWLSPTVGMRASGVYSRSSLPADSAGADLAANRLSYDLDLIYRPFLHARVHALLSSAYAFVGAGGHTTRVSAKARTACVPVPEWTAAGICLDRGGTTAQGVVGVGTDIVPARGRAAVFVEAAVHGFDSPVDAGPGSGKDAFVLMPRVMVGARLGVR